MTRDLRSHARLFAVDVSVDTSALEGLVGVSNQIDRWKDLIELGQLPAGVTEDDAAQLLLEMANAELEQLDDLAERLRRLKQRDDILELNGVAEATDELLAQWQGRIADGTLPDGADALLADIIGALQDGDLQRYAELTAEFELNPQTRSRRR